MEKILAFSSDLQKIMADNQSSLFGDNNALEFAKLELARAPEATKKQILSWERELMGMYVSEHPLAELGPVIERNRTRKINEITSEKEGEFVRIAGVVTTTQKILTRSNQKMVFAKLEDLNANAEILVFPKLLESIGDIVNNDKILAIDGFVSFKDGAPKILAENIYEIDETSSIPAFVPRGKKRNGRFAGGGYPKKEAAASTPPKREETAYVLPPQKLTVIIPDGFSKEHLMELKEIFAAHQGESEVFLRIQNGAEKEVKIKARVNIGPVLLSQVKELAGRENVLH